MKLMPANTVRHGHAADRPTWTQPLQDGNDDACNTTSSTINSASDGNDGTDGNDDTGGTSCHNMYVLLQGAEAAAAAERPTSRDGDLATAGGGDEGTRQEQSQRQSRLASVALYRVTWEM